ncbi:discoidin domain-containing protein [bacterium]|nr:discoidin domain-containing protein [bacterium]
MNTKHSTCQCAAAIRLSVVLVLLPLFSLLAQSNTQTPPNFKIAIMADGGLGESDRAVLQMIKNEGAQAVIHSGDIDQKGSVAEWDAQVTEILGLNFPYFAAIGDDDGDYWDGAGGLQQALINRLNRAGITWSGDLGVKSSLNFQGLFILLVAPGIRGTGHDVFIREQLAADNSIWSICSWHKNMHALQVCEKPNGTGYGVYEEARLGGSLIANGHCHSYARTHLLSSMTNQTIASTSNTLQLEKAKSFVMISGLGGEGKGVSQSVFGDYWAKVYTQSQNSQYGALFATFNVDGQPNKATFYFKNINGQIIESFTVVSNIAPTSPTLTVTSPNGNEAWPAGSMQNLTWNSFSFADPVRIEYSGDAGASWQELAGSVPNSGSFAWTINVPATTQGRIRVSDAADGNPTDVSDGNFKIIGPATHLVKVSGDGQTGTVNTALAAPFVVRTTDAAGNPVSGVAVSFEVTAGGGSLSNSQPQFTNSNGEAATVLTLGASAGANTVTATAAGLSGSPQTFAATASSQPPASGNLARNHPATASSTNGSYAPSRAVDGNTSTYWRSASVSKTSPNTWLRVDLDAAYMLTRGVVKWRENYYARRFRFQISNTGGSNDSEWTTVATITTGAVGTQDVPLSGAFAARYFRIRMDQNNKDNNRITELECYAGAGAASPPVTESSSAGQPGSLRLRQNYPNPFNPSTTISFDLPQAGSVTVQVYSETGALVRTLLDQQMPAGGQTVSWNGRDDAGLLVAGGVYFYRIVMRAEDGSAVFTEARRMTYLK